jgi:Ser/Thr protein kinase RdoA (MazF antagonist)
MLSPSWQHLTKLWLTSMGKALESIFMGPARAALEVFPVEPADIELVMQSENVTFRVTEAGTGADYVLRLHRPGYHTLAELNAERAWTHALGEAGIAVQGPVRTTGGDFFQAVEIPEKNEFRYAGMTEWVEGTPLSDRLSEGVSEEEQKDCFRQIGALAATIHNKSEVWSPPAEFERHTFDAEGLMGETPFWGRFWEHSALNKQEADLLNRSRSKIYSILDSLEKSSSIYSMIHADLHANNVLVHDGIVVPIDFDDAGFGWHIYELAVVLFNEQGKPGFDSVASALVEGYREVRELDDSMLELLPLFVLVRGLALIGWLHHRPEHDSAEFLEYIKSMVCAECEKLLSR